MKIKRADGLNIVPFIDVMLVLLAIVLSVSTFIAQGKIPINLPQADNIDKKLDDKKLNILISADNKIYVDDVEQDIDALRKKIFNTDESTMIEVKSDKDAKFENFVKIISIIKEKGHENFSIAAQSD
ncbi:TonB system transport protein ExbD [Helicobacter sp. CLO-3]|uniref:TonB system transport protein ExbD n=1 Tax=unclassified Helicobacter TaxID=2593540 RepID=UPI000805B8CC|nr:MULTISPECIES: TonB system transport protein ExbD [unclassified Helicobacter]OBV28707.1 TonB system transport protein ExbD [Helicobacter sp. CLO-3]OHU84210.1 TonB system transport protein ExbD [Helicobacter sp. CLO-3]